MAVITLYPDGGANTDHSDAHAAVNHSNDSYDDAVMNMGKIAGNSEGYMRFLLDLLPGSRINSATFRIRFKAQNTGTFFHNYMTLAIADRKNFIANPNYVDGHFIKHQFYDVAMQTSAGGDSGRVTYAAGVFAGWKRLNYIGGVHSWLQELIATGTAVDRVRAYIGRTAGSRPSDTFWWDLYAADESGAELKRGALLGQTETMPFNDVGSVGYYQLDLLTPFTPDAGTHILMLPRVSYTGSGGSQIRLFPFRSELYTDAATQSLRYAPSGEGYAAQGAFHVQKMDRAADYPHLTTVDVTPPLYPECTSIGEWGWATNGDVVAAGSGGIPTPDAWYEIGDDDIPIASTLQSYIDDPNYSPDESGVCLVLTKETFTADMLCDYHNMESGSPAELVIDYTGPGAVRLQGVGISATVQAAAGVGLAAVSDAETGPDIRSAVDSGPVIQASAEADSIVSSSAEVDAAVSVDASAGAVVEAGAEVGPAVWARAETDSAVSAQAKSGDL